MVMWPALSLIGFLVLTALVVAMATKSTARYEAEKLANRTVTSTPEPARAAVTAAAVL